MPDIRPDSQVTDIRSVAVPLAICLLVALISGTHIGSGIASHGDSRTILEETVPSILNGAYVPSRSYGNPLYEFAAALLYPAGGLWLTSAYSFALAIGSVWLANALIEAGVKAVPRALLLAALCFNPLFIINAFAVTEWMQATFLLLSLLWFARRWLDFPASGSLAGIAVSSALLVLTRPDAALIVICLAGALIWHLGPRQGGRIGALLLALIVSGVATIAVFGLLNHGYAFLRTGVAYPDASYARRVIVAAVGIYSVFGLLAPFVLIGVAAVAVRNSCGAAPGKSGSKLSLWMKLFVLTVPVVFLRLTVLPDKLEYMMALLVLAILLLASERVSVSLLALCALSSIIPSIATLSLFDREIGSDQLSVRPHIGPGAVAQELAALRYNWRIMNDREYLRGLGDIVYADQPAPRPDVYSRNWAAGLLSSSGDVIIGKGQLYHFDSSRPGSEEKYQRKLYSRMFICDRDVWVNGSYGWRLAEPALTWAGRLPDGKPDVKCRQDTSAATPTT